MAHTSLDRITQALLTLGGQRVWSLVVSLFGDLAQDPDSAIDGPVLGALMHAMDIKPEAVRVALYRLRNDGWIESEKTGRIRRHRLTPLGRAQSIAASARIYGPPRPFGDTWQLALLDHNGPTHRDDMQARGFVALMPRVYLGGAGGDDAPVADALMLDGAHAPDWLRNQIAQTLPTSDYRALLPILRDAAAVLGPGDLSALQVAVLRCLVVHNWRRIVLRHPDLPTALLPKDWPGHTCHEQVATLLARFDRPDLDDIRPD
ncbi:PaaX family transcriptional regulator C-terminal domain-containing protein [Sulfitobacter sp. S190]|uniref:PaaX family transcriptional regulator C-terminal domain-containing protein n=1 Tax=Sulfitobacter sp. S190 TaxID=2867022 RepID=UPI0021A3AD6E|nr:PaaX family transcriptional regulator C-terminal domain-containing protein [Sulfitobacter sp. S190]UWR22535.1 PaaX family transcriptional regulator [Sulfitobacter sp. S190]